MDDSPAETYKPTITKLNVITESGSRHLRIAFQDNSTIVIDLANPCDCHGSGRGDGKSFRFKDDDTFVARIGDNAIILFTDNSKLTLPMKINHRSG